MVVEMVLNTSFRRLPRAVAPTRQALPENDETCAESLVTSDLAPALPAGWEAVTVDARAEIPAEHHDADVLVVWGSSRAHLASAAELVRGGAVTDAVGDVLLPSLEGDHNPDLGS